MRTYRTAVLAVVTVLSLAFSAAVACAAAPGKIKPSGGGDASIYETRPDLALPAGMKLTVVIKLRLEDDAIGNWLADQLQQTEGYCPGENGDFRLPWQLYQELLAHLAAPSRLDDDYPQARWDREQFVIDFKAIPLCDAGV